MNFPSIHHFVPSGVLSFVFVFSLLSDLCLLCPPGEHITGQATGHLPNQRGEAEGSSGGVPRLPASDVPVAVFPLSSCHPPLLAASLPLSCHCHCVFLSAMGQSLTLFWKRALSFQKPSRKVSVKTPSCNIAESTKCYVILVLFTVDYLTDVWIDPSVLLSLLIYWNAFQTSLKHLDFCLLALSPPTRHGVCSAPPVTTKFWSRWKPSIQSSLLPHKISPSISLSHPLVGKNRPLVSLLILTSHRSNSRGKGFKAVQVCWWGNKTDWMGKREKDNAELCNFSVPTTASRLRLIFPWHCRRLLGTPLSLWGILFMNAGTSKIEHDLI